MDCRTVSLSAPRGELIRFEIPGFGLVHMRPGNLTECMTRTAEMSVPEIRQSLISEGWDLGIFEAMPESISRISWIAIWGECHGHGIF